MECNVYKYMNHNTTHQKVNKSINGTKDARSNTKQNAYNKNQLKL